MFRSVYAVDGAINVICIYLAFNWNSFIYKRLCFYCDKGIRKCCLSVTKQSAKRKITEDFIETQISKSDPTQSL